MRHAGVCPDVGFRGYNARRGGQSLLAKRPAAHVVMLYVSVRPRQGKSRPSGVVIKVSP
jgi:hypothetical protein